MAFPREDPQEAVRLVKVHVSTQTRHGPLLFLGNEGGPVFLGKTAARFVQGERPSQAAIVYS
jgi:hypothetical protein